MAASTNDLPFQDVDAYDYLIVGGGTAGCVVASRLAEYLPHKKILLIEAGPSDFTNERVLDLKQWLGLMGGELDYDYGVTEQIMGMLRIHSLILSDLIKATPMFAMHVPRSWVVALRITP